MYRILYFEDHPVFVDLIREILQGFDIVSTASLRYGRRLLESQPFDLLMVDLKLVDSDGLNTVEALTPFDTPIMVLTADNDSVTMQKVVAAGATDFECKDNVMLKNLLARVSFLCMRTQKLKQEGGWIKKDPAISILKQVNMAELYVGLEDLRKMTLR